MIIKHEKLGDIKVSVYGTCSIQFVINDKKIIGNAEMLEGNKSIIRFSKKQSILGKEVPGIKITETEYKGIKDLLKKEETRIEEEKYQKWLNENATYNCSYDFSSKANYSEKAIKKVRYLLIKDDSIKKITGFGDYNTTETFGIKNKDLIKMLDDAEKEVEKETDAEIEEKIELEKKIFAKAKATNTRQELKSYIVDCDDDNEACEIDNVIVYALPSGFKETVRSHNW